MPISKGTYELGALVIGSLKFSFHIFQGSGLFNLGHFLKGEGLLHRDGRAIYLKSKAEANYKVKKLEILARFGK